jgi:putative (di)nucleoside polyphosphate hydrolase
MSKSQYFRAGAGCVIYNDKGQILLFSRADKPEVWQFPQGGMDAGESTEETLWRELLEETGLIKSDFSQVTSYPEKTLYEYPAEMKSHLNDPNCLGQVHSWYFLKINPETQIYLSKVAHPEFNDHKWSSFEELLEKTDFKKKVYQKLHQYFLENVVKQ